MTTGSTLQAAPTPTPPAAVIDDPHHPAVRRVADALCSRAARPRTILIDDKENIAQAARAGVELIAIYSSADRLEDATQYGMLESTPELHLLSREMLRGLFTGEKHSRVFALARAPHSGEV